MKRKAFFLSMMMAWTICFMCGCEKEVINIDLGDLIGNLYDHVGNYIIVNTRTNDTLEIKRNQNKSDILNACNGDTIKVNFEPEEKYKECIFKTKYTFLNGQVVENKLECEYVIADAHPGEHAVRLEAWNDSITASGVFTLKVIQ